jgi:hypothetical protein
MRRWLPVVAGLLFLSLPAGARNADFDGSGVVDFGDFFLLADQFGRPGEEANRWFDLDGSGVVDFGDFFLLADPFGAPVKSGQEMTFVLPGGVRMELVWIEPGQFAMGAPESEPGRYADEGPQHAVTLTRGFYLGKYEITQGQWAGVMGTRPWGGKGGARSNPNFPAVFCLVGRRPGVRRAAQ